MNTSTIKELTATGDVTTHDAYLRSVVLTAGALDAASVVVRAGGSGGTVVLTVKAAAGATVQVPLPDAFCADGVHATLTGTTSTASFSYA